jgi:hypothetical protein
MLVELAGGFLSGSLALLEALTSRFGIRHPTLQTEEADEPACPTGTCEGPG